MSCDSCHPNGRAQHDFFIEGVSGAPGTVDVTGGIFSRTRDDGLFNPVPIPSLVDVGANQSFGSMAPMKDLQTFVRVLITEEFQGVPPDPIVERALIAYLRALRSEDCPSSNPNVGQSCGGSGGRVLGASTSSNGPRDGSFGRPPTSSRLPCRPNWVGSTSAIPPTRLLTRISSP